MLIPITKNKFVTVGSKDYAFLMQWCWCYSQGYAARMSHKGEHAKRRIIYMHRVILERMGHENFARSDHRDRNRLNNYRHNLRPATQRQNTCNRSIQSNNTSGYTGVGWHKRRGKWRADITINGKSKHLGYYDDPKEAIRAYNKAALKYHDEFAVLNEV
jgi:hypothetical protein